MRCLFWGKGGRHAFTKKMRTYQGVSVGGRLWAHFKIRWLLPKTATLWFNSSGSYSGLGRTLSCAGQRRAVGSYLSCARPWRHSSRLCRRSAVLGEAFGEAPRHVFSSVGRRRKPVTTNVAKSVIFASRERQGEGKDWVSSGICSSGFHL